MGCELDYDLLPEHLRTGARLYIEEGIEPGGFLRAVLENNFLQAFMRADSTSLLYMRDIAAWVYNEAPTICCGSKEHVDEWIEMCRKRREKICDVC